MQNQYTTLIRNIFLLKDTKGILLSLCIKENVSYELDIETDHIYKEAISAMTNDKPVLFLMNIQNVFVNNNFTKELWQSTYKSI